MTSTDSQWRFHDPTSTSSRTVTHTTDSSYTISIHSGARTDWWTTAPGSTPESSAHRTTGPVLYQTHHLPSSTSWRLSGLLSQPGTERFQQTTLFIKRSRPDESGIDGQVWLKAGVENEGGRQYAGVVATNPYSDWNVSPLPKTGGEGKKVLIEIEKVGVDVHVYYTVQGGEEQERFLLREKKGFALTKSGKNEEDEEEEWWVGAMVCGPLSESTQGTVDGWKFEILTNSQTH